ncbi:hypothetical protein RUM44_012419 [Polyplax serrata]|uniref:Ribonuclease P protein subunit p29 n=1 Tax=Polyplax serrata TaxID=468196 RepID=A0ABR1BFI0_POLSC
MAGSMNGQNKFSIDDAFDENSDEPIRVYGSTTDRSPHISKHKSVDIDSNVTVWVENPGLQRLQAVSDDTTSKDSDSLIRYGGCSSEYDYDPSEPCWKHPKIKENWKMVLAAGALLVIGICNLSKDVKNRVLRGIDYSKEDREKLLNKFISSISRLCDDDPEGIKKSFVILQKTPGKKLNRSKKSSTTKLLSYRKRRELGLYAVGKKSLKYAELVPLHELWKDYMTQYMQLDTLQEQKWKNSPDDPNFEMVAQKLYRADYHGAEMTVTRSNCYSLVGASGIVVMETKFCFKLLGKDNIVRTIPKASCAFSFHINNFKFSFFGKNMLVRPAQRSAKKIKLSCDNDL